MIHNRFMSYQVHSHTVVPHVATCACTWLCNVPFWFVCMAWSNLQWSFVFHFVAKVTEASTGGSYRGGCRGGYPGGYVGREVGTGQYLSRSSSSACEFAFAIRIDRVLLHVMTKSCSL